MSELKHKSHNVSRLVYHIVCPAKYRRVVFTDEVDEVLRDICLEIEKRYEIDFLEIGADKDQVHFLVQSVPMYRPKKIAQTIKSLVAREVYRRVPEVKRQLWGGQYWSDGYYMSTVSPYGSEETIRTYVKKQRDAGTYKTLHEQQLRRFD